MPVLSRRGALLLLLTPLSGCSLGVMAGKMLTGEPTITCQFKSMTGTDLTKGKHRVVVICSTPAAVDSDLSTLNIDLVDGITRRLRVQGIDVINPDRVAQWIDDNGGVPSDPSQIARDFEDVDYIAWIDVFAFSFKEENSQKLHRGRTNGFVRAYKVEKLGSDRSALAAFNAEFSILFPPHQPISATSRSELSFQKEFMDRICSQLAEKFYDHRPGTDI